MVSHEIFFYFLPYVYVCLQTLILMTLESVMMKSLSRRIISFAAEFSVNRE